jgi:hypothetical protein
MRTVLKFAAIWLILAGTVSCKDEHERGKPIHPLQEIVFAHYYINYAWGYTHQGFLIDRNGLIHVYSQREISPSSNSWNFPDANGYITAEALKENLGKTRIAETRISADELHKYAELIALVKENDYSEHLKGADMGAQVNVCYLYDDKTHTYKEITLSQQGDRVRTNNSSAAKSIDEWLNTVKIEDYNNHVLMLMVDYTANKFEGGNELRFKENHDTFTVTYDYNPPGDFGDIKLFYSEINEMLFYGTVVWMGCGKIEYPEKLLPADSFPVTLQEDYMIPANGFETVFHEDTRDEEYNTVWSSVQNVIKVREYLASNPGQKVKIFFYTPSVGLGNPADWKWILFLKK